MNISVLRYAWLISRALKVMDKLKQGITGLSFWFPEWEWFAIMHEQECQKIFIMKLWVRGKYRTAVLLSVTRRSVSYRLHSYFSSEVVYHPMMDTYSASGQCKKLLSESTLLYLSPSLECKPSPIPDISTHFCQLPHWTGALRSGNLVIGPAGDARVSSASTFLFLCICATELARPAQVPSGAPHLHPPQ